MAESKEGRMTSAWNILTGARYIWRVWPVKFIIRPIGYAFGPRAITLVWALGYLPRIRIIRTCAL